MCSRFAREWAGRKGQPSAICIDSRTLQSTPQSGARAGYDGAKRRKGSKVHIAVDTLGHRLALTVTPAGPRRPRTGSALAEEVQQVMGNTVELAYVDQATPDATLPKPRNSTAYGWKWSSTPWQNGLRASAQTMDRRTLLPMGRTLQTTRQRLRTTPKKPQRNPLHRIRYPHDQQTHQARNFITPSRHRVKQLTAWLLSTWSRLHF